MNIILGLITNGSKCIMQLRGIRPFLSEKFDITKHKNYKLLEDYDDKNYFDVEEYMERQSKSRLNKGVGEKSINKRR